MNQQERNQLNQLLKSLVEFKLTHKDMDAASLIQEAVTHQPDAAYLLVQRVLLMEEALSSAQARIAKLQKKSHALQSGQEFSGFFLVKIYGIKLLEILTSFQRAATINPDMYHLFKPLTNNPTSAIF